MGALEIRVSVLQNVWPILENKDTNLAVSSTFTAEQVLL